MTQSAPIDQPEPPRLRTLRWLVTGLTLTMIAGLITIMTLLVLIYSRDRAPALPDGITLPEGQTALAVTHGSTWSGIVAKDRNGAEFIHVINPENGEIRRSLPLTTE